MGINVIVEMDVGRTRRGRKREREKRKEGVSIT